MMDPAAAIVSRHSRFLTIVPLSGSSILRCLGAGLSYLVLNAVALK